MHRSSYPDNNLENGLLHDTCAGGLEGVLSERNTMQLTDKNFELLPAGLDGRLAY